MEAQCYLQSGYVTGGQDRSTMMEQSGHPRSQAAPGNDCCYEWPSPPHLYTTPMKEMEGKTNYSFKI